MANYARFLWRRSQVPTQPLLLGVNASLAPTTFALNSAANAGYGTTFIPMDTGTITDVWVSPSSYTGTWSATDQVINAEVRLGITASNRPGATVVGSPFTIPLTGGDTTKWVKKSGLSISLTAGTLYSIIFNDADGGATNFVTMFSGFGGLGTNFMSASMTTANAWAAGSSLNNPCAIILKIAGKMYGGGHYGSVSYGSSTRRRGNKISVPQPIAFIGLAQSTGQYLNGTPAAGAWTAEIFIDSQAPNATPVWTHTYPVPANAITPFPLVYPVPLNNQYLLVPGHTYRIVARPVSATTLPAVLLTFTADGPDQADIFSTFAPDGISISATEEANATTWNDDASRLSTVGIALGPPVFQTVRG